MTQRDALLPCPDDLKELLVKLVFEHFSEAPAAMLTFKRWKDGIDRRPIPGGE